MAILQLEQERTSLKEKLLSGFSNQAKLLFIYNFFEKALATQNKNFIDSYLPEFLPDYLFCLKNYSAFGLPPFVTEQIILQAEKAEIRKLTKEFTALSEIILRLKKDLENLKKILNGEENKLTENKPYFPLLDEQAIKESGMVIGVLESVTIKIHRAKTENKFIIVPSEKEIEEKINEQVKLSWLNAINTSKKYVRKIHPHHEVLISFDKRAGFCKGNSLGTALTLAFIEELLKTYNSPVSIKVGRGNAFTGGMDGQGRVTNTSGVIIKQKTELVFFTDINLFAVPREDEKAANEELKELHKEFPDRNLVIVGVDNLSDVLNRRDLVEIKKLNPVVRSTKFVKKNRAAFTLLIIIAVMFYFAGWWDLDDNPKMIEYEKQHINVYNKNKKLLWNEKVSHLSSEVLDGSTIKRHHTLLVDINNDGKREIILNENIYRDPVTKQGYSDIICLDNKKNMVWAFNFDSTVSTKNITFSSKYVINFLGLYKRGSKDLLYVSARNEYFPSAVFGIDVLTGERATDVFWHSGHLADGFVFKDDSAGKEKIFLAGINNGFECVAAMVLDLENLSGQAIAPENYVLKDIPTANMEKYILIPKSDVAEYYGNRYNAVPAGNVIYYPKDKLLRLKTSEDIRDGELRGDIQYFFNPDLSINFIETGDAFQLERDKLVKEGKLSPPLTYTAEYFDILKNNIRYWNGEKFVKK